MSAEQRSTDMSTVVERKSRARAESPAQVKTPADQNKPENIQDKPTDQNKSFWEGFGGMVGGSFFRAPLWVDAKKPPGVTKQVAPDKHNLWGYFTGIYLFWSPNLVWLLVALVDYFVFPYEIDAKKVFTFPWMAWRFFANFVLVFGYVAFWHVTLYFLHWGKRPFNPDRKYRWSKVIHNFFYNVCGIMQWTLWEAVFVYCYGTGRLPYITDKESFGSYMGFAKFALTCVAVAVWRDVHFYFAHRIIHIKFFYKYVHSLHHRNTDIEPFAGLCMHPIEHLLYYACAGPALYFKASPFNLMWFGIHLMISPAASHSGYEDNFQSDQYHYLHHRFFECNYGTGAVPYDKWFGTFRDSLDVKASSSYKGAAEVVPDDKKARDMDAKATLVGLPKWDEAIFNIVCYGAFPLLLFTAAGFGPVSKQELGLLGDATIVGLIMALGPAVIGMILLALTTRRAFEYPSKTFFSPFHKEKLFGAFGINVFISLSVTVLHVYHGAHMFVSEPGQGIYFSLYGK